MQGVGERGEDVGCLAQRCHQQQGCLGLSHLLCRCLLSPWSISSRVWLALSPCFPHFGASACFSARLGRDKPEGGFPVGAKLGTSSKRKTVDREPHLSVFSCWAGHPTHSLCVPLGTCVSLPQQGHVSTVTKRDQSPSRQLIIVLGGTWVHGEPSQQCGDWRTATAVRVALGCSGWPKAFRFGFVGLRGVGRAA